MFNRKLRRIATAYLALQLVIWVKCAAFFSLYGFGKVARFNKAFFPAEAITFNFFFHEAMHVGIAVLALLFGKNMRRLEWLKLVAVVFIAVALHNFAYWFSKSHPSLAFNVQDFVSDSVLLLAFVVAGFLLNKSWRRRKQANAAKQKI